VSNGPGTGQEPAPTCPNDKKGGDNTGHGANNGSVYDSTCDGRPSQNGQGGGGATGRPCMGCVGNADDKNPGNNNGNGQYPGPKNDRKNRGYECDDNNGVGKGNPAHTGCAPVDPPRCPSNSAVNAGAIIPAGQTAATFCTLPPPCVNSAGASQWTLSVSVTNGTASHSSTSYSSLPGNFTITATAASGYSTTGGAGGPTTASYTTQFSNSDCAESFSITFIANDVNNDCLGHPLSLGHNHTAAECNPPQTFDCAGHLMPNNHPANECDTPPVPDCDNDGINDNVDADMSSCNPLPPKADCDRDGIPDESDTDMAACDPDEVLGIKLCPDGSLMPPNGKCDEPSVLPDEVLGIRLNQPAAVAPAVVNKPAVAASLLPFTGGNIFPFVLVSLSLIGAGLPALRRRKK
jgi:hypothetical protein